LRTKKFWDKFFQHPLQLHLEKDGHTIERLSLYIVIHHDHHYIVGWASESFWTAIDFDKIRMTIEEEFNDLYKWLMANLSKWGFSRKIEAVSFFFGHNKVHGWAEILAHEVWQ